MFKKITLLVAICLSFFATNTTTAQIERGTLSVHIGPTIPMDYSVDNDNYNALGAGIGLGLGIQYTYPLTKAGVGLFLGLDINYNATITDFKGNLTLKDSVKVKLVHIYLKKSKDTINVDVGLSFKYLNVPISAGVNYTFKAGKELSVYTSLGLIYNFFKITDFIIDFDEESVGKFNLSSSFGMKIGGGIILNDKTYILITNRNPKNWV